MFSPANRAEVEDVLEEKFGWAPDEIGVRKQTLWCFGNEVTPKILLAAARDDDDRIL